jgi:hypothetical protein
LTKNPNLAFPAIAASMLLGIVLSIAIQSYGNQPSYYSQYSYKNSFAYSRNYAVAQPHEDSSFYKYPYQGNGPYLMAGSSCNNLYGCRQTANSHMYVDNALDYTYYTHPELLEPRYMDNHQRLYKGLWPQAFSY